MPRGNMSSLYVKAFIQSSGLCDLDRESRVLYRTHLHIIIVIIITKYHEDTRIWAGQDINYKVLMFDLDLLTYSHGSCRRIAYTAWGTFPQSFKKIQQ